MIIGCMYTVCNVDCLRGVNFLVTILHVIITYVAIDKNLLCYTSTYINSMLLHVHYIAITYERKIIIHCCH